MNVRKRCAWVEPNWEANIRYHDEEWGTPVYDDHKLFEMIVLESFQAGLSWAIILKKRENFRKAFDGFVPQKIAKYTEDKVQKLLLDQGIVRSRSKIEATIQNAKSFLAIQSEFGSFANYLWKFTGGKPVCGRDPDVSIRQLAIAVSSDLKRHNFKFMGPTTTEAFLQAVGVIENHDEFCYRANNCC